ncbi:MAG TPA: hypothetical protein VHC00_19465 [Rhizobiaceae bacterium]|nr:hypothetical protein [Rhizobiaceae bacterium]
MSDTFQIVGAHIRLSANLLLRFGAPLGAIWMGSCLLNVLLLRGAVEVGLLSRFAGLIAIVPVILLQLLVFAAMFIVLRDGLPSLRRRKPADEAHLKEVKEAHDSSFFTGALAGRPHPVLWLLRRVGLALEHIARLFDTVPRYADEPDDFLNPDKSGPTALEVESSLRIGVAVLIIWGLRRAAKEQRKKTGNRLLPLFVVACETTWVLLGLYLISGWQDRLAEWLAQFPPPQELFRSLIPAASAEVMNPAVRPVDWPAEFGPRPWLTSSSFRGASPPRQVARLNWGIAVGSHSCSHQGSRI